jgi:hypothetical protein
MPERRFPPPWSVEDPDTKLGQTCFIVRDANRQAVTYVYNKQARPATSPSPRHPQVARVEEASSWSEL